LFTGQPKSENVFVLATSIYNIFALNMCYFCLQIISVVCTLFREFTFLINNLQFHKLFFLNQILCNDINESSAVHSDY
jgi:hypothetical protein